MLNVCENNEVVTEMVIKGRSLTMRHVSRIHRVALDWLFDRINLDSKIQIRYIDIKHQLENILTKSNFKHENGIIFFICTTSVISVLLSALRIQA